MNRSSLTQRLLHQWDLKAIALLAASLLAVYVRLSDPTETRFLALTLRPLSLPADYMIEDAEQLKITAVLEGPVSALRNLSPEAVPAYVRFGEIRDEGTYSLPVTIGQLPGGVEIREYPKQVSLAVAHFREQVYPVEIVFLGAAPEGMQTSIPSLQPSVVSAKGPKKEMDRIHRVVCYLRFSDIVKNPAQIVPVATLDVDNQLVHNVWLTPDKVSVSVSTSFAASAKIIPIKPQLVGNLPYGYFVNAMRLDPQVVLAQGRPEALSLLDSVETGPIDLTGATQSLTLEHLPLQYDARQVNVTPPTVNLTIDIRATKVSMRFVMPVTLKYAGPGAATVRPTEVAVTLYGLPSALQKVSLHQMEAIVTVTQSTPGAYTYRPKVKAPEGLEALSTDPAEVTVEVRR